MKDYVVIITRTRLASRALIIKAKSPIDAERKSEAIYEEKPFDFKDQSEEFLSTTVDYLREDNE